IEFFADERILDEPRRQRNPCTIFVGDMFDLFHEAIPTDLIVQVFRAICVSDLRHTFQILTKRAARMKEFFSGWSPYTRDWGPLYPYTWPRPNIWIGVSVEDQQRADERIPLLLQTPAAVRFLSVEPVLEQVDLLRPVFPDEVDGPRGNCLVGMPMKGEALGFEWIWVKINLVIVGGESGPNAREFNLEWAELLLEQCRSA